MVAETHPPKTNRSVRRAALPASIDTTLRITAHTAAQPMLYPVYVVRMGMRTCRNDPVTR